jgi:hypothetical protein
MLRAAERPAAEAALGAAVRSKDDLRAYHNRRAYPLDVCDDENTPPRREMPGMGQRCQGLATALEAAVGVAGSPRPAPTFHGPTFVPRPGMKRLMREMRALALDPHPHISVLPGEDDVSFWHCVVDGAPAALPLALFAPRLTAAARLQAPPARRTRTGRGCGSRGSA